MQQIRFSVVIPIHNGRRHIGETLDSMRAQHVLPDEIVIVDDHSTDAAHETIAAATDLPLTLVCPAKGRGVQAARNTGVRIARNRHVALCDHDDPWLPGHLEAHARLYARYPDMEFSFSNFFRFSEAGREASSKFDQAPPGWWESAGREIAEEGWLFGAALAPRTFEWHPIFPSGTVFTKDLFERVGAYNEQLRGSRAEDGEFTLRCLYAAKRIGALPSPSFLYRRHPDSTTASKALSLADEVKGLKMIRETHLEARPWHDIIDREISKRRLQAFDAAFAEKSHSLARELLQEIDTGGASMRQRLKVFCVRLPDAVGLPLNSVLQRLSRYRPG